MDRIFSKPTPRKPPRTEEEWAKDRPSALEILAGNLTLYRGFDDELKADAAIAKAYVSAFGWGYPDLPMALRSNNPQQMDLKRELAIAAITQNPRAISRLPSFLLADDTVRSAALSLGSDLLDEAKLNAARDRAETRDIRAPYYRD